jgi:hypothetical protein
MPLRLITSFAEILQYGSSGSFKVMAIIIQELLK